jgi:hypothetical protein
MVAFVALGLHHDPIIVIANHPLADYLFWVGGVVFLMHLVLLIGVAANVQRSPLLWVLGALCCSSFGAIIAYVRMTFIVRRGGSRSKTLFADGGTFESRCCISGSDSRRPG